MKLAIVCGARPNFIKVAPIIRVLDGKRENVKFASVDYQLIYTGAENDATLENSLFDDLDIKRPDVFLGADSQNLNELTGLVMAKFEKYLQENPVDAVIVVDDLASTMATAIVTKKQGILLAHIAAGTRSFDITMPKEINRLVIDGLSDILFTAGISNNSIANKEGAELSKVYMVGNILMDNLRYNHDRIEKAVLPDKINALIPHIAEGQRYPYIVFTLNRKALIGDEQKLRNLVEAVIRGCDDVTMTIIAPLRPDAAKVVEKIVRDSQHPSLFNIVEPLNYLQFSYLTAHAAGIITDSGNVAEEATFNQVPCITLNSYTEHIETVKVGTNVLVGEDPDLLAKATDEMCHGGWKKSAIPDRWDGRTAERILQIISQ